MCISYVHFIIKVCINPFSVFLKHMQINVSFKVALVTKYSELCVETCHQWMHINSKLFILNRQALKRTPHHPIVGMVFWEVRCYNQIFLSTERQIWNSFVHNPHDYSNHLDVYCMKRWISTFIFICVFWRHSFWEGRLSKIPLIS